MKTRSYRVENIKKKEDIACNKQFLLFSQCFPQLYIVSASNVALCDNGLINTCILFDVTRKLKSGSDAGVVNCGVMSIGECNTFLSAYTKYRHLG